MAEQVESLSTRGIQSGVMHCGMGSRSLLGWTIEIKMEKGKTVKRKKGGDKERKSVCFMARKIAHGR